SHSPLVGSTPNYGSLTSSINAPGGVETQRLREELNLNKSKLVQWEEGIAQARKACDAWKKEAEDSTRRAKIIAQERDEISLLKCEDNNFLRFVLLQMAFPQANSGQCRACQSKSNPLRSLPCGHFTVCEPCLSRGAHDCPLCHQQKI
ncbi:hypothetical protein CAPTEDRAFT_47551, partial [Capitella teleta]